MEAKQVQSSAESHRRPRWISRHPVIGIIFAGVLGIMLLAAGQSADPIGTTAAVVIVIALIVLPIMDNAASKWPNPDFLPRYHPSGERGIQRSQDPSPPFMTTVQGG